MTVFALVHKPYPPVTDLGKKTPLLLRLERQGRTVSQVRRIGTANSMLRNKRRNRDSADRPLAGGPLVPT